MVDWSSLGRPLTDRDLDWIAQAIPYAAFLGITLERREGKLVGLLPYQDMLIGNPMLPALHGGVIGAFLETVAMVTLLDEVPSDRLPKPVDIGIDYLRSARPIDSVARAEVTKLGRRVSNVRVTAWQDDPEKPVAGMRAQFILTPAGETGSSD